MDTRRWIHITLFNLIIVALLGVIMRYKIPFTLSWIDQKHALHAHSHFAFGGWITQALMILIFHILPQRDKVSKEKNVLLSVNLFAAYGMLISFLAQGYGAVSIAFSTLSIVVSIWFLLFIWRKTQALPRSVYWLFRGAASLNVLSSIGPFWLAYLMINQISDQQAHLSALYFFLHFQYNGWFFLACLGLLFYHIYPYVLNENKLNTIALLLIGSALPNYLLSILWMKMHWSVFGLAILGVLMQGYAVVLLFQLLWTNKKTIEMMLSKTTRIIWSLSALAFFIKIVLQSFSLIPSLSTLAFGFRPIVIGYLHLVLLGVISLFILGMMFHLIQAHKSRLANIGIAIFISGIILNEFLLMTQGVASIQYVSLPHINLALLFAACVLFAGAVVQYLGFVKG